MCVFAYLLVATYCKILISAFNTNIKRPHALKFGQATLKGYCQMFSFLDCHKILLPLVLYSASNPIFDWVLKEFVSFPTHDQFNFDLMIVNQIHQVELMQLGRKIDLTKLDLMKI